MPFRKLIPRLIREAFVDAMRAKGWPLLVACPPSADTNTPFNLMFGIAEDAFVSWVEPCEQPLVSYLVLDGRGSPAARDEVIRLSAALDERVLLSLPDAPKDELNTALSYFAVGVGSPSQYHSEFWTTLMKGLGHESPLVRKHVLAGLRYVAWAGDTSLLVEISRSDSAAENRESAAAWLNRHDH